MTADTFTEKKHLAEWLRRISLERRSGLLQVRLDGEVWKFHCVCGEIRAAAASPATLLDAGRAKPELFVRKVLARLAGQRLAQSSFSEAQQTPPPHSLTTHLLISSLLPELARTTMEPALLRDQLTSAGELLISSQLGHAEAYSQLLSADEAYLLSRFDSPLKLNDALSISPFDEALTLRYIGVLYLLGLVQGRGTSAATPPSEPPNRSQIGDSPKGGLPNLAADDGTDWLTLLREIEERSYLIAHGTFYDLLEIPRNASDEEIKTAYYGLAKRFHPDHFQAVAPKDLHEKLVTLFGHLSEAYQTLADPTKRSEYDQRPSPSRTEAARSAGPEKNIAEESFNLGKRLVEQDNYEKSLPYLREAVRLKPDAKKYRSLLARALSKIPQHRKDAEEQFLQLIEMDSHNPAHFVGLGALYKEVNLLTRARKMFEQALELDPQNAQALKELGRAPVVKPHKPTGSKIKTFFSKK
jgi:curved DNA-binding protein CbpA